MGSRRTEGRRSLLACLIGIGLLTPPGGAVGQPKLAPLPIESVLSARSLGQFNLPQLSADGKSLAYTVCDSRRVPPETDPRFKTYSRTGALLSGIGCDVWIAETLSGEATNVTAEKGSNWGPSWSPDGSSLAFYSDQSDQAGLWVWSRDSARLRRLSDLVARPNGLDVPRWTTDGRSIVMRVLPQGMTIEQAAELQKASSARKVWNDVDSATVTIFESPAARTAKTEPLPVGAWSTEPERADLAVVDVSSGNARRIVTGEKPVGFWLSPDGSSVAYLENRGFASGHTQQVLYDLSVVPLAGGRPRRLATSISHDFGKGVSWSPDSKRLAYLTAEGECFVVSAAGGASRKVARNEHPPFRNDPYAVPLWDARGESMFFLADDALWRVRTRDGSAAVLASIERQEPIEIIVPRNETSRVLLLTRDRETKNESLHEVVLATGATRRLWTGAKGLGRDPACRIDAAAGMVVLGLQDAASDEDWWILRTGEPVARRLTHVNPEFDRYVMGESLLVDWLSGDGTKLQGALLLPAGYQKGKRYPLVVFVYNGGRLSNSIHTFGMRGGWGPDDNFQLLATRGYAVLLPDAPSDWKEQMRDLPKSVLPGINRVIELGIADPYRLGVMGHSNGGYSALALITQTPRFGAAVMRAGYGSFFGIYGELGPDGSHYGLGVAETAFGMGSPWEFRNRYLENSPVFYLDRVETPLLIVHGAVDPFVAPFLSEEIFVGLRRLGKRVVYARYEGESHWLQGYANRLDYCSRMIAWFDEHLKKHVEARRPAEENR